jgi:hypothetical protein
VEEKNCRLLVELDYSPDHTPPSPSHKINPGIYGVAEQPSSRTSGQAAEARAENLQSAAQAQLRVGVLQTPESKPNPTQPKQPVSASDLSVRRELLCSCPRGARAAMRCKLHPQANAVGVCAPCLRDRLLAVAAERDHQAADDSSSPRQCQRDDASWAFPRSASPYAAAHRRSDACAYPARQHQPSLRFFRTPQVGPAQEVTRRKVARGRRSFLAAIFGVGGRHAEEGHAKEKDPPRRSLSWLSAIVRRKRRPDASLQPAPQPDEEAPESSPGGGSSTTTTSWWFPSPSPARQHHHRRGAGASSGGMGSRGSRCA